MFEKTKGNKMQQWGSNPTLYAPVDFFGKKKKSFYGPPLCVYYFFFFFFFIFLKLRRNRPDTWSIPSHITPEPPKMIFGLKKLIKGPKMVTKRGQKLYK
jgi:hypothetical protein